MLLASPHLNPAKHRDSHLIDMIRNYNFTAPIADGSTAQINWVEAGPVDGRLVVCVHGLTGCARDFDWLALSLAEDGYRVASIDLPGRGQSDRLNDPKGYCYKEYLNVLEAWLNHLGAGAGKPVYSWIGTSLGGLLGMRYAALGRHPVSSMLLNDIGPDVPADQLELIRGFIREPYRFETFDDLHAYMIETRGANYGPMTDAGWLHFATHCSRQNPDGSWAYAYDPAIYKMFDLEPIGEKDIWPCWDGMDMPVLALRGAHSTIFPADIAEAMRTRGPGSKGLYKLVTLPGCGHVPSLMAPEQIDMIRDWLRTIA